jgi:1,4-alpha-glucan branching enzyme
MAQQRGARRKTDGLSRLITERDVYLFKKGSHFKLYDKLGSHLIESEGVSGVRFAVWAPGAREVAVIGSFNDWDAQANPLNQRLQGSGIWEAFVPAVEKGDLYKYHIVSEHDGFRVDKGDPYAFTGRRPRARLL